jgi:hypothetical protein
MKRSALLIGLLLFAMPAFAGTQQDKMTHCNAEASRKNLTGDAHQAFMKKCLSGSSTSAHKELTPQQAKMKQCNHDASAEHLTGQPRKDFMSSCLKG